MNGATADGLLNVVIVGVFASAATNTEILTLTV
jgi:hypothetical protein